MKSLPNKPFKPHNFTAPPALPEAKKVDRLESEVESRFHLRAKKFGFHTWKFKSPNNRGVSDRILISNGRVIFIEMKRSFGEMTPKQQLFRTKVMDFGGEVVCIYGDEGVDVFLEKLIAEQKVWDKFINPLRTLMFWFSGIDFK